MFAGAKRERYAFRIADLWRVAVAGFLSLWGMMGVCVGETQVGNVRIAMQPGECRLLLNGVDIGCPSGAVHTRLENGRHLVNFPGGDISAVGFAGQKIEVAGNASSVLWIDAAYINQQRLAVDGQCAFKRKEDGVVELECKAILRDGRKLSASLKNVEQKDSFLGVETATAGREKCERLIRLHGMLTRAQFQCKFSKYNTALIDEASGCMPAVGKNNVEAILRDGMTLFDSHERERGHKAVCSAILADFPKLIRR
ncbi:MAG: hypothetical protein PS018_20950 [bacterium]|nr:hypothetical protein [bacterium]